MAALTVQEWILLRQMGEMSISSSEESPVVYCAYMKVQPYLIEHIRSQQPRDEKLAQILSNVERFSPVGFSQRGDGLLTF